LARLRALVLNPRHEWEFSARLNLRNGPASVENLGSNLPRRPFLEEPAEFGIALEIRRAIRLGNPNMLSLEHDLIRVVDRGVDDVHFA
jgi:hypothetical protein